jgi:hypothetical protein
MGFLNYWMGKYVIGGLFTQPQWSYFRVLRRLKSPGLQAALHQALHPRLRLQFQIRPQVQQV